MTLIRGLGAIPYQLPFAAPWRSHGLHLERRTGALLRISDESGRCGYGDLAPLQVLGTETLPQARCWLDSEGPQLAGLSIDQALSYLPPDLPATRHALECALLDLQAKQEAQPLWSLLATEAAPSISVNANIGGLDEQVEQRATKALKAGYQTLKLKLGLQSMAREMERLRRLADTLPRSISLRLDANRAWTPETLTPHLELLNQLPIDSLEEPLRTPETEALQQLQQACHFDLALDESIDHYLNQGQLQPLPVRRLVIKPLHLGGLRPCLALIRQAHQLKLRCVITSSLESSAGLWPLIHLAAICDRITGPQAHGLATGEWFRHDLGTPPPIIRGRINLEPHPGSGFILSGANPSE